MLRLTLSLLLVVAGWNLASAQGTISNGGASWQFLNSPSGTDGNVNFDPGSGLNQAFQNLLFYRIDGDASENSMPAPSSQSYIGSEATITWLNVDGRNFDLRWKLRIFKPNAADSTAYVYNDIRVTNNTGGTLNISVYNFLDIDVNETFGNDEASLNQGLPNAVIEVMDGATNFPLYFHAMGATAYQVTGYPLLRDELNDGDVDDLDNSGLPFSGDYTGAFQHVLSIPAGQSQTFSNTTAAGDDQFLAGPPTTPEPIPTLSQWGLFLFGLVFATLGLVLVYQRQTQFSGQLQGGMQLNMRQMSLPFHKELFKRCMTWAIGIGILGFGIIQIGWEEILPLDIIGVTVSIPIIAYALHVVRMMRGER